MGVFIEWTQLLEHFFFDLFQRGVAHILALDHVDHVFRHVLGVVAHAFDRLGDNRMSMKTEMVRGSSIMKVMRWRRLRRNASSTS